MGKMKNSFGGSKAGQEREVAGARKVIFGSDGPWLHPSIELYKIRVLGLSPRDEQLVLGGNILRLIRNVRFPVRNVAPSEVETRVPLAIAPM